MISTMFLRFFFVQVANLSHAEKSDKSADQEPINCFMFLGYIKKLIHKQLVIVIYQLVKLLYYVILM